MNQEEKLSIIKDILLTDEREFASSIEKKINILQTTLNKKEHLADKVDPIIDDKLNAFIKEIPQTLGPTITEALKEEITNSQDAVVEALFPILGKMVKRFIQNEMRLLSEKINNQLNKTFSFKRFFSNPKSNKKGVTKADRILQKQFNPKIEQLIFVEKGSGIVLAEYSKEKAIDEDMVAGMLTAIKSFVEDAFKKESQDLNYIEYDHFHIHLQNFSSYYIAVIVSGAYNVIFKDKLEDKLLEFTSTFVSSKDLKNKTKLTQKIKDFFNNDSF
ncbi:cell envelope biogenesis protein OmpA [Ichthyenterobacterium sp. W332]|uniref:Cell envelope biogenesis protein OmpA n=1 Tax=Microcosmobacter mediterraneus TaxID=3075607 RepID=A0ABU2YK13_9FLAO|nr:cell envelope biogenesis protein OmpA [Ichthyenterobacterium sp. W332]MDT0558498.1 cell envelope biogenesis protein OmpA [Ichthyenterobacterium sp. W332]